MAIRYVKGNIFDQSTDCIAITINCVGVMGAGLAREAAERYPFLYKVYKHLHSTYQLKVTRPSVANIDGRLFLLFPTKHHYNQPSEYWWIENNLDWILDNYPDKEMRGIESITLPQIGCGLGGLKWEIVHDMIRERFADHPLQVDIIEPA